MELQPDVVGHKILHDVDPSLELNYYSRNRNINMGAVVSAIEEIVGIVYVDFHEKIGHIKVIANNHWNVIPQITSIFQQVLGVTPRIGE